MNSGYTEPTVEIIIEARFPGEDWHSVVKPAEEYVYTHAELCRTLSTYMLTAVRLLPPGKFEFFRLVIRSLATSSLLATWEWKFCPTAGQYLPPGDAFTHWPEPGELSDAVILGALQHSQEEEAKPPTRYLALVAYSNADAARAAFARQAAALRAAA